MTQENERDKTWQASEPIHDFSEEERLRSLVIEFANREEEILDILKKSKRRGRLKSGVSLDTIPSRGDKNEIVGYELFVPSFQLKKLGMQMIEFKYRKVEGVFPPGSPEKRYNVKTGIKLKIGAPTDRIIYKEWLEWLNEHPEVEEKDIVAIYADYFFDNNGNHGKVVKMPTELAGDREDVYHYWVKEDDPFRYVESPIEPGEFELISTALTVLREQAEKFL
jgi:hypothetical protein